MAIVADSTLCSCRHRMAIVVDRLNTMVYRLNTIVVDSVNASVVDRVTSSN